MNTTNFFEIYRDIDEFEKRQQWEAACKKSYDNWYKKKDLSTTIRGISECWYMLSYMDMCNMKINKKKIQSWLIEMLAFGDLLYKNEAKYLWLTGYLFDVTPYVFDELDWNERKINWDEIEREGKQRLEDAKGKDKDIDLLYIDVPTILVKNILFRRKETDINKKLDRISEMFSGDSLIEEYFYDVSVHQNRRRLKYKLLDFF